MKIATWNINSLRIREPLIARFLTLHQPDVLCLQETKVEDQHFPHEIVQRLGYGHCVFTGEKSYNGVAILSKTPLKQVAAHDMIGNGHKRHIAAELADGTIVHNFYVPAGGDVPDTELNPKFDEKLRFVDAMRDWAVDEKTAKGRVVAVGDFNIAPLEHDVWSSRQLRDVVSHTPIEREKFTEAQASGQWFDALRAFTPAEQKLYSWWSYRNRDWAASDRGRRLDHIWLSPALKAELKSGLIVRDARGFDGPSDHVPVMVELAA
ncbi:MAG: exodeoxyribonuclease III [Azospirillum brasilense]|nr:MAG: exodeoxyribonuclease III [Azospirillum brasilense]